MKPESALHEITFMPGKVTPTQRTTIETGLEKRHHRGGSSKDNVGCRQPLICSYGRSRERSVKMNRKKNEAEGG